MLINATVDIAHKITIQNILLKSYDGGTLIALSAIVNAMILVPFILLFSPSGYISDRFAKSTVIRYSAMSAVALTLLITLCYYQGWFVAAFIMTFLLAAQSAIYSPSKYGLIRELAGAENLGAANGVVQAITIIAILLSSIIFSAIFELLYNGSPSVELILQNIAPIGWILVALSIAESYMAFKLPLFKPTSKHKPFNSKSYFKLQYLKANIKKIREDETVWLSILGLSLFWAIGQITIATFPAHYKMLTGDENAVTVQAILAISAIGLAMGSILAGRLSRHHIELGIVPVGAIGLFASSVLFATSSNIEFMVISSISFGFFGGLFIIPLNASIQFFAKEEELGVILAGNNFIQNIAMFTFLIVAVVLVQIGFSTTALFLFSASIALIGALFAVKKLPHFFARIIAFIVLRTRYRISVKGVQNIPLHGSALLLGNHISWIDWLIVQIASPRAINFVMDQAIYSKKYLQWFFRIFNVIPISGASSKRAIREIRQRLDGGEVVVVFPEGHISHNGQLGEFKKGFMLALRGSDHPIIPFYIHGMWGSTFSRAQRRLREMTKEGQMRDTTVAFGKPLKSNASVKIVKDSVRALSYKTWEEYISGLRPLQYTWLKHVKLQLLKRSTVDAFGVDLNNAKMAISVLLFTKQLKKFDSLNVGVLLPSSSIGSIINMALLVIGKRPINLNYTTSKQAMISAIVKAQITTVISSEAFLSKLSIKGFKFPKEVMDRVETVEYIGKKFTKTEKSSMLAQIFLMPAWLLKLLYFKKVDINETATLLFSSGSEGEPKGVELTHKNLMANIKQVSALLNFRDDDAILNSLPIFHSFGLTVTTLLPMCEGIIMISAPDPTDAATIGKLAARYQATIMFGTSTFYRLYAKNRKMQPVMLKSIRMAIAGAERLKPDIKSAFKEKFNLDIYEGYGATEASPVISVNMPDGLDLDTMQLIAGDRAGTVGQSLPGTIVKIVDPQTLEELKSGESGLILIGGPQVMKGYYNDPQKSSEAILTIDKMRFYRTGDKGHVDDNGFITIVDRYSRFVKIGGEMISLGSVEEQLEALISSDIEIVATSSDDKKKGEKIILIYSGETSNEEFASLIKRSDILPIMRPSALLKVESTPKLTSGKGDFKEAKRVAQTSSELYTI